MVRNIAGQGLRITRKPPASAPCTSSPCASTMAASMPGNGCVHEPGLVAVAPGSGEIMMAPVSVCHQVSTMGQRLRPMCSWYHIQASGLMGSPTEPSNRSFDRSYLRRDVVAELHERADRGRRGVENRHAALLDDFPETSGVRRGGTAFVDHHAGAGGQRAVGHVAVPGHPADVGGAPEDVVIVEIEHPLAGELGAEQIARARMLDALGLSRGSGGIEQEQRMFGIDPHRLAHRALPFDDVVPPQVARLASSPRPGRCASAPRRCECCGSPATAPCRPPP